MNVDADRRIVCETTLSAGRELAFAAHVLIEERWRDLRGCQAFFVSRLKSGALDELQTIWYREHLDERRRALRALIAGKRALLESLSGSTNYRQRAA